jgi:hypothetical protein
MLAVVLLVGGSIVTFMESREMPVAHEGVLGGARIQHFALSRRHVLSRKKEQQRRANLTSGKDYEPQRESFEMVVPARPAAGEYGLLVWIDAGPRGAPARADWVDVLARAGIIWAGPNNVGNTREVTARVGLAVDVVNEVSARNPVDPGRVYVGGMSGGAKSALRALLMYPDIFQGGVFVCGADYFREVRSSSERSIWPARFGRPLLLSEAKQRGVVLVTGSNDFNLGHVTAVFEALQSDGFEHARLLELPGLGHALPDGSGFARALALLE